MTIWGPKIGQVSRSVGLCAPRGAADKRFAPQKKRRVLPALSVPILILVFMPAAIAQTSTSQPAAPPPQSPETSSVIRSYPAGSVPSSRQTQTRTESGNREVITETTEVPGINGRLRTASETVTETVRGPSSVQVKRDTFEPDSDGRPRLVESTQTEQQTLPDGTVRTVENTFAPDLNGRLGLSYREIAETRSTAPDVKQTDTTIYRPGLNSDLRETERVQQIERQVSKDVVQSESTHFVREVNGGWQAVESTSREDRTAGPERTQTETVLRLDANGALTPAQRTVTRTSKVNGQEQVVSEIYSQYIGGTMRNPDNRMQLDRRIRVTTTAAPGGGRQTIQETESRNPVAPNEQLRVVERIIETVAPAGSGRLETERQVFRLDGNGRLVPVITETGESPVPRAQPGAAPAR